MNAVRLNRNTPLPPRGRLPSWRRAHCESPTRSHCAAAGIPLSGHAEALQPSRAVIIVEHVIGSVFNGHNYVMVSFIPSAIGDNRQQTVGV